MTAKDYKYFEVARTVSYTSDFRRVKIGAVVVIKRHIVAVGANSTKTHPIQKKYNKFRFDIINNDTVHSLHAETQALLSVPHGIDLTEASIYTYRENAKGELVKSRPCPSCIELIKDLGIRKIYYTTNEGYCEEIIV